MLVSKSTYLSVPRVRCYSCSGSSERSSDPPVD
jgi:hypothetical protein